MEETLRFLVESGVLLVTLVLFLDQLGLPIPPEPFLLGVGALGAEGRLDPILAGGLALAAASAGTAGWIGTWILLGYLLHHQLERVVAFATKWGGASLAVVVAAAVVAGTRKILHRRRVLLSLRADRITVEELKGLLDAGEPVT